MTTEKDTRALAKTEQPTLGDTIKLGATLAKSGFFADAKQEAQAVVKVLAGQELGISPVASMTGIHIIQGKVALGAQLMGAVVKRSGRYWWEVKELTDKKCVILFYAVQDGRRELIGESSFSLEDAQRAGLTGKGGNWHSYTRNMLWARSMSNGCRWFCPDVFGGGVYDPEEIGAPVNAETGEVVEGKVVSSPVQSEGAPPMPEPPPDASGLFSDPPPVLPSRDWKPADKVSLYAEALKFGITKVHVIELLKAAKVDKLDDAWPVINDYIVKDREAQPSQEGGAK